jgi:hypothetical protein
MAHCEYCKQEIRLGPVAHRCAGRDAAAKEQAEARRSAEAGSVSVGVGQHAAAALWKTFKEHERTYVDMLEAAACLIVNVADKTESTDHEIHTYVWKLTTDMRANAARSGKPNA